MRIAKFLSAHQTCVVWVAYFLAWCIGAVVSLSDWRIPFSYRLLLIGIFFVEFAGLALVLWLIDQLIKVSKGLGTAGDVEEFLANHGAVFVLFLVEYLVIIVSCGIKYWTICAGGSVSGIETFKITLAGFSPRFWDWMVYSAENVIPVQHAGVIPLSIAARVFSMGQLIGNLIITVLLLNFTVSILRFEKQTATASSSTSEGVGQPPARHM